jgi:hypothetical protein
MEGDLVARLEEGNNKVLRSDGKLFHAFMMLSVSYIN